MNADKGQTHGETETEAAGPQISAAVRMPVPLVRYGNALRQKAAVWSPDAD